MMDLVFWAYPVLLCTGYLASKIASSAHAVKLGGGFALARKPHHGQEYIFWLHCLLCLDLFLTVVLGAYVLTGAASSRWGTSNYVSAILAVALFYIAQLLPDADAPYVPESSNWHAWCISSLAETSLLAFMIYHACTQTFDRRIEGVQMSMAGVRVILLLAMISLYWYSVIRHNDTDTTTSPEETQNLLPNGEPAASASSPSYGSVPGKYQAVKITQVNDAQQTTWVDYVIGFQKLFPYLWPSDSRALQLRAIFCFFLLIAQRVDNILLPHQLGVVVKDLGTGKIPWASLALYIVFRALQGQQGVIGSIRALLWIPISQSTYRRLTSAAYEHVLMLSLDFHLSKRIGEVMSALSKGSALNTFLDGFAFQLLPMVADLWIAAGYFWIQFNSFYALMVITVTWIYLYVTIYMAKYRGRARRTMVAREREMEAAKTDALMAYETVHHNTAVKTELGRFGDLISVFQTAEYSVFFSLNLLNAVQNGVFTLGVALLCALNAYQISVDLDEVSRFVTLLTYLAQLQAPLNFFGSFYTQVQNNLVDAERMLDLFNENPSVVDTAHAKPLDHCNGKISFKNVNFAYDSRKPILKDVSFEVEQGTSTAIVGESGSGKSTILKLLFRFYNIDSGTIAVDGVNVDDIQIQSLRKQIGVVPQDTILFNASLMYNLLYARVDATEEDVYNACRAASIHDRIMQFPNGYDTSVGERGLKLSGGEKQRITIARTFLRAPAILLLDEATASLDTLTEVHIQEALEKMSEGRTTITIAHRISTVTNADQIIVMNRGEVVEKGKHQELLSKGGVYAHMWYKQTAQEECVE